MHKRVLAFCMLVLAANVFPFALAFAAERGEQSGGLATGVVFADRNGNGIRDAGEESLPGIRVSNQHEIVEADAEGRWRLPVSDETIFFVIKPRNFKVRVNALQLPQFYYIHKPAGSPPTKYPGVSPTGPLPESIDFGLIPSPEPDRFRIVLTADPQARDEKELEYMARDVVEELRGTDAAFGVTLGDIVDNTLSLLDKHNGCFSLTGIPWYNVIGNHDSNQDSPTDEHSDETFESKYGPNWYSFDYGPVHFVVLDDIHWRGPQTNRTAGYEGRFGPRQLEFLRNDLALVPQHQLVVLMMHIPLTDVKDRQDLYRIIEQRPHCVSFSGHKHCLDHRFITADDGWGGDRPHHHFVNGTVSGGHYAGAPDEVGVAHATMADGAPNGYSLVTFDGNRCTIDYKAARRPADYQMNIYAPFEVDTTETKRIEVVVNVFAGSERSTVRMRLGEDGEWLPMQRTEREDPQFLAMKQAEEGDREPPGKSLRKPKICSHLWAARLPLDRPAGAYFIHVQETDLFGRTHESARVILLR